MFAMQNFARILPLEAELIHANMQRTWRTWYVLFATSNHDRTWLGL